MRPGPCRRAPRRAAEEGGEPDREVQGAPRKARVGEEGSLERLYHPLRSPSPTRRGSARVEEGRHPWGGWGEGGCRPRVIHFRHLWLRRWAEWGSSGKEGLVKGKTKPSTLGGWRLWASILSTSRCQALSWERGAPRGEDKEIYMVVPRAPSLAGLLRWESVCRGLILLYPCAVTASPQGPLRTSDWVVLNCSFSRPDFPASVRWFRGPGRVPVQKSPHHHLDGSFLFLPKVSPVDSGLWGCILTYRDGFSVSSTYNLTVLGNSSSPPALVTTMPCCPLPISS